MAKAEWVLRQTLVNLRGDVELCEGEIQEGRVPNYDLRGTLMTNLSVCIMNKCFATPEQLHDLDELRDRAEKILEKHECPTLIYVGERTDEQGGGKS